MLFLSTELWHYLILDTVLGICSYIFIFLDDGYISIFILTKLWSFRFVNLSMGLLLNFRFVLSWTTFLRSLLTMTNSNIEIIKKLLFSFRWNSSVKIKPCKNWPCKNLPFRFLTIKYCIFFTDCSFFLFLRTLQKPGAFSRIDLVTPAKLWSTSQRKFCKRAHYYPYIFIHQMDFFKFVFI